MPKLVRFIGAEARTLPPESGNARRIPHRSVKPFPVVLGFVDLLALVVLPGLVSNRRASPIDRPLDASCRHRRCRRRRPRTTRSPRRRARWTTRISWRSSSPPSTRRAPTRSSAARSAGSAPTSCAGCSSCSRSSRSSATRRRASPTTRTAASRCSAARSPPRAGSSGHATTAARSSWSDP